MYRRYTYQALTVLLFTFSLFGCSEGSKPSESFEVAVKGTYSAAISPDAEFALIGSITHGGSLWRVHDHERLYNWNHKQDSETNIVAAAFSPESHYAFTADHQTMVLWDTQNGQSITFWTAPHEVLSVALGPNADFALLGLADHSVVIYDVQKGGIKRTFYHKNRVRSVALSDDGKLAISGSEDDTAKLWDVASGKMLHNWQHNDEVRLVAIAADGSKAFSVSKYDKAILWNTQSGAAIGELPLQSFKLQRGLTFTAAEFSADGNQLLTGSSDRVVQLWDTNTRKELKRWILPKRDKWKPTGAAVAALAFDKEASRYYAVASNGYLHSLKP
jgi:hypothetical protein